MVLESNTYIDISPYHEILSGMNFILSISVGVVKLTGPEGTGKTRLLEQLETELEAERQQTLLFPTPPASIKELHDSITRKLKLDNEFGFNKALIHHIIAKPYDQQRLVVIFDNAESIDIDVLLAIALFRNILHNGQPIVSIVLCGNETLNTKLEDSSYRPLVEDMLLSYELHPLTREQLQAYGQACADVHRLGKLPLKNGVLTELLNESKGLPGPVPELLKQLKAKVASGAVTVKAEEVPVPVAVVVSEPEPKPEFEPAPVMKPAKPAIRIFGKQTAEAVPVAVPVLVDTSNLSPDERLIVASRAEKEAAAGKLLDIDWQRWKPAMQGTAVAAGLVVVAVLAWPRVAPVVSDLYVSLTESPAPEVETPASEAGADAPELADAPEPTPAEPEPVAEPELPVEQEVVAVPEPEPEPDLEVIQPPEPVVEPEPAPEPAPEPQVAAVAPPTPAPAQPAPQVTRVPGPTVTDADADELEVVIRDWLMAWEEQDVDDFFSYYHTDFAPLYQNTLSDWRMDRQTKISRPASIMIELEDFMVGPSSRIGTRVSFWMTYESPNYADRTLKEVLIGPDVDGQWRILQEYNQQTAPLGATVANAPTPASTPGPQRTQIAANPAPASPIPTPVAPPPVATRASLSQDQIDGIARFLAEWLTAWQNQDVDDYFRHYEPAYKPDFMASSEQWRNDRIAKISRPQRIVLRMDQLEIVEGDSDSVRVQLVLEYHSTHYADRTLKEIELRKAGSGDWLIAEERNREVEPLPLMRLLPVDSLAFLVMR